jgi:hypothetical protein
MRFPVSAAKGKRHRLARIHTDCALATATQNPRSSA